VRTNSSDKLYWMLGCSGEVEERRMSATGALECKGLETLGKIVISIGTESSPGAPVGDLEA
jgi:hypothetical protein